VKVAETRGHVTDADLEAGKAPFSTLPPAPRRFWTLFQSAEPWRLDNSDADLPAGQLILSNSGTPDQAVEIWNRVVKQWRLQHPSEFKQFKTWAASGG